MNNNIIMNFKEELKNTQQKHDALLTEIFNMKQNNNKNIEVNNILVFNLNYDDEIDEKEKELELLNNEIKKIKKLLRSIGCFIEYNEDEIDEAFENGEKVYGYEDDIVLSNTVVI
jgi:hypothetical protein